MDDIKEEQTMSPVLPKIPEPVPYLFTDALKLVMDGMKVTRLEWGNTNIYGALQFDENYKTKILVLHKEDDKFYQWILSEGDLLGDDWVVLPEGN